MTWHLKDKELEEKLLAIDPDFIDNLNNSVEYHKENKTVEVGFGDGIGGLTRFSAEFRWGELEEIKEYNPHDWNEYPAVTPPEDIAMRIECCFAGNTFRECAIFKDGYWRCEKNNKAMDLFYGTVKRFRPWED